MPIGLGLACSHAPGMYTPKDKLQAGLDRLLSRAAEKGTLVPSAATRLTTEMLETHWDRFRADHAALRNQLHDYNPDALIIVGGDQSEMFDASNKVNALIYTGKEAIGINSGLLFAGVTDVSKGTRYTCDSELAEWLLNELVTKEGFDIARSGEMSPMGPRKIPGLPHAFVNPAEIMPKPDLPVILLYENTFDPPSLIKASRCYQLGQAMARVLSRDNRRVAIYGSGGLSHDPAGPRNIWVDEPLDHWILEQISNGNGKALSDMYAFDSMTMRGGTGEVRSWITVAGAMEYLGAKATIVDYLPAPETQTGCGFAYWLPSSKN